MEYSAKYPQLISEEQKDANVKKLFFVFFQVLRWQSASSMAAVLSFQVI